MQWAKTLLYDFSLHDQTDGQDPQPHLIFGGDGALYGTTMSGGTMYHGTVFKLTPPAAGETNWTKTTLFNFGGSADGASPMPGLIRDASGAFYGATLSGGVSGCGTVFKLTVKTNTVQFKRPDGSIGSLSLPSEVLEHYSFKGRTDGCEVWSGPILGASGALYGTTMFGGDFNKGTVYELKQ
jgi:uncharacterized repeat protein (TIGR03803 family)